MYFKARKEEANGFTYMQVGDLKMDFSVKDIKMGIKSKQDNAIIGELLIFFLDMPYFRQLLIWYIKNIVYASVYQLAGAAFSVNGTRATPS